MTRPCFLMLLTIGASCSSPQAKSVDPMVGKYVAWSFLMGEAEVSDGTHGISQKLTLNADGTFTYETQSTVMMRLSVKAKGKYTHNGNTVTLSGTQVSSMDDGYKKSDNNGPYQQDFQVEDGMLVMKTSQPDPFYFRKEGTGPPPLPKNLKLKKSDNRALGLVEAMEKTYGSLKSFRAKGTVRSHGGGFVAEKARFTMLYQGPSKFRFSASILDGETEYDWVDISWSGAATCTWNSKEFGLTNERGLGNAMSIVAVKCGPEADILPSLLLPKIVGDMHFKEIYPESTLLPNEKVNGKDCTVVKLRSKGADATKLWIDSSNGMIVRYYEELRDVTVDFDSSPNATIDPKDFNISKRSKG